jgi:hypothetical protein
MGLEPTTFCMARRSDRSRQFAGVSVKLLERSVSRRRPERPTERERTSSVTIVTNAVPRPRSLERNRPGV